MAHSATPSHQTGAVQKPFVREAGDRSFAGEVEFQKVVTLQNPVRRKVTVVASAGSVQGDAAAIPAEANFISVTGADGTKGAILPPVPAGSELVIYNAGGSALKVYPQTGGAIGAGSANASVNLSSRATFRAVCLDGVNWTAP
jgi:hypothetical protein